MAGYPISSRYSPARHAASGVSSPPSTVPTARAVDQCLDFWQYARDDRFDPGHVWVQAVRQLELKRIVESRVEQHIVLAGTGRLQRVRARRLSARERGAIEVLQYPAGFMPAGYCCRMIFRRLDSRTLGRPAAKALYEGRTQTRSSRPRTVLPNCTTKTHPRKLSIVRRAAA